MKSQAWLLGIIVLFHAGCASHDPQQAGPPPRPGIFNYSRSLDHNDDGRVSYDEWVAAGGREIEQRPLAEEQSGYLKIRPDRPLSNLMIRVADVGNVEPMTPPEFRSPAGARLANLEF